MDMNMVTDTDLETDTPTDRDNGHTQTRSKDMEIYHILQRKESEFCVVFLVDAARAPRCASERMMQYFNL
jgi:hypothetical protein